MDLALTPRELGQRIMKLRKAKGLSQHDVAQNIAISRSSFAQIELGNRSLDVFELQRLSVVLGFSLGAILSNESKITDQVRQVIKVAALDNVLRVIEPELRIEKFVNVTLYLLEYCAGKANINESGISNLLYFCDFNYYEMYEEHLTGALYRKLSNYPIAEVFDSMINHMINTEKIKRIKVKIQGINSIRYLPLESANLVSLNAAEKTVIDQVILRMSYWSARMIQDYSQRDFPLMATKEGDRISYNLVFYRELPHSVRTYD